MNENMSGEDSVLKPSESSRFVEQLVTVISDYERALQTTRKHPGSVSTPDVVELQTRCIAAVERIGGRHSSYYMRAIEIKDKYSRAWTCLGHLIGVAKGLLYDVSSGYLRSVEESVREITFLDFLELSDRLLELDRKDPAAIIAGVTLEVHLRAIATKYGVSATADGRPKRVDRLNAELVKAGAYSKSELKHVTAWLSVRNAAVHGQFDEYSRGQVQLLVSSVRDFAQRNPA